MKKLIIIGAAGIMVGAALFGSPYRATDNLIVTSLANQADLSKVNPATYLAAKKVAGETTSENWAGYAASGSGFTEVSGSWVVPTVQPGQALATDAAWVGIGGVSSQDLIQSGTQAVVLNGKVQYQAWTEILPADSKQLAIDIHPGDNISVDITEYSRGKWRITFADVTTGKTITKNIAYNSSHSSAEWIEEAPSDSNGVLPLDNFGSITFGNCSAARGGKTQTLAAAKAKPIALVSDTGITLASTSGLNNSGVGFSVTRSGNKQNIPKNRSFRPMETWTHKAHNFKN
jgi:hypothetical protein